MSTKPNEHEHEVWPKAKTLEELEKHVRELLEIEHKTLSARIELIEKTLKKLGLVENP